jgi:flavin reductase (DIM6/NTAB) family NADH-FMN oxidoreductase RutF
VSQLGDRFDAVVGSLDPSMVVVTTAVNDVRSGCLVGFHSQCSISPKRYAVWISKANHTYTVAVHAEYLALHVLAEADGDLAALFGSATGDEVDKFALCEWTEGPGGVPLLDGCPNWMVLRRTGYFDEGSDHVCVAGEPVDVGGGATLQPLRLSAVSGLTPGHEATDRPSAMS